MRLAPVIDKVRTLVQSGAIGQLMELRGRGKEDRRAGGEDLMVLGTHVMDLMRLFAGDARWVTAQVTAEGHALGPGDVRDGNEGIGPLAGDTITATYGFDHNVHGFFGSKKNAHGNGGRFGLDLFGSKGIITIRAGMDPAVHILDAPAWAPQGDHGAWKRVTAGSDSSGGFQTANARIVADLIDAIEHDRRPRSSGHDGRAALEMILAVYKAELTAARVTLPMTDRKHPLRNIRHGTS